MVVSPVLGITVNTIFTSLLRITSANLITRATTETQRRFHRFEHFVSLNYHVLMSRNVSYSRMESIDQDVTYFVSG